MILFFQGDPPNVIIASNQKVIDSVSDSSVIFLKQINFLKVKQYFRSEQYFKQTISALGYKFHELHRSYVRRNHTRHHSNMFAIALDVPKYQ